MDRMGGCETWWYPRERSRTRRWQEHPDAFAHGAASPRRQLDSRHDTGGGTSAVIDLDGGSHALVLVDFVEGRR
jgi:hypothetical protein